MNVLVFDVPATSGGALTILNEFYEEAKSKQDVNWIFVISSPYLKETSNIQVLRFPWVKKSWLHRLYFDYFIAPKVAGKHKADEVLSLQNVTIPSVQVPQRLYIHQALPFADKRFSINESLLLWVNQNIIGRKIFKSIKKADRVIVQSNWMKDAITVNINTSPEKIVVEPPKIKKEIKQYFEPTRESIRTFFYPASGYLYKNHKVIVDAAMALRAGGAKDYKIIFTLRGDENKHVVELYKQVKENDLSIEFIGAITLEQVYEYYGRSVLVFPSYVEAFGLPMLEAKMHKTPVLASDCPFSHEILDGYENARFFRPDDSMTLAGYMM